MAVIPSVHLAARGKLGSTTSRATPLTGPDLPTRVIGSAAELNKIIDYLNVENSPRYQPGGGSTFCNVYAFDYCYLGRIYIPRVWWTRPAIAKLKDGIDVPVQYGDTVAELNANGLFTWLATFGAPFGWKRLSLLEDLQHAANDGCMCLISGIRRDTSRPGHISCVVPEGPPQGKAQYLGSKCVMPIQSQAGAHNFHASTAPGRWWEAKAQFSDFAFWRNKSVPR